LAALCGSAWSSFEQLKPQRGYFRHHTQHGRPALAGFACLSGARRPGARIGLAEPADPADGRLALRARGVDAMAAALIVLATGRTPRVLGRSPNGRRRGYDKRDRYHSGRTSPQLTNGAFHPVTAAASLKHWRRSIPSAPRAPVGRTARPVGRITIAIAADAADRCLALRPGGEAAIGSALLMPAQIGAPRVIGFSLGGSRYDGGRAERQQRDGAEGDPMHGGLLSIEHAAASAYADARHYTTNPNAAPDVPRPLALSCRARSRSRQPSFTICPLTWQEKKLAAAPPVVSLAARK